MRHQPRGLKTASGASWSGAPATQPASQKHSANATAVRTVFIGPSKAIWAQLDNPKLAGFQQRWLRRLRAESTGCSGCAAFATEDCRLFNLQHRAVVRQVRPHGQAYRFYDRLHSTHGLTSARRQEPKSSRVRACSKLFTRALRLRGVRRTMRAVQEPYTALLY